MKINRMNRLKKVKNFTMMIRKMLKNLMKKIRRMEKQSIIIRISRGIIKDNRLENRMMKNRAAVVDYRDMMIKMKMKMVSKIMKMKLKGITTKDLMVIRNIRMSLGKLILIKIILKKQSQNL
jgi:hypothetical protein